MLNPFSNKEHPSLYLTMKHIILHHSAINDSEPQFDRINEYHRNKWWFKSSLGFYAGYHFFIERDGRIIQARDENEEGAHCYGWNKSSIGICLAGDFRYMNPSEDQAKSLSKLVLELELRHGIPKNNVFLHREKRATSCPCTDLRALISYEEANKEVLKAKASQLTGKTLERFLKRLKLRSLDLYYQIV